MDMRYECVLKNKIKKRGADHCNYRGKRSEKLMEAEVPAHIVLYLQLWQQSQYTESLKWPTDLRIETRLFWAKACSVLPG